MHFRAAAVLVALSIAAAACQPAATASPSPRPRTPAPDETARPTGPPISTAFTVVLEPFADVPNGPLAIAAPDDDSGRLFVASQAGQIWSVGEDGSVLPDPMVDLSPFLVSGGEQGLLGLALHPDFPDDPRAFVNFTGENGDTSISSIALDPANPARFDTSTLRQLVFVDQPYANHNGGGLAFGPDGYLYIALGDGGSGGDPHDNGQRLGTLLGKILRIDVNAGDRYAVPPDNPFVDADGMDEIWHSGLRNPWRFSFDRETGDLWIGDVGQGAREEIDVARGDAGGLNFGWNRMEGSRCFREDACSQDGLTLPVTEYGRDLGSTVIGGYVYRGEAFPVLVGAYLFADYGSGSIFTIDAASSALTEPVQVGQTDDNISAFGEGANGELYVTTLRGTVYRVTATE